MNKFIRNSKKIQRGAALVEYSLLIALISIVSISSVRLAGSNMACTFDTMAIKLRNSSRISLICQSLEQTLIEEGTDPQTPTIESSD
jgi:Flp pilus assembly pilin Flp